MQIATRASRLSTPQAKPHAQMQIPTQADIVLGDYDVKMNHKLHALPGNHFPLKWVILGPEVRVQVMSAFPQDSGPATNFSSVIHGLGIRSNLKKMYNKEGIVRHATFELSQCDVGTNNGNFKNNQSCHAFTCVYPGSNPTSNLGRSIVGFHILT